MNNEELHNINILMELQYQSIQVVYQTITMLCTSIATILLVIIAIVIKTLSGEANPMLSIFMVLSLGAGVAVNAHYLFNEYQDLLNLKLKQKILKRKKEKIIKELHV